MGARGHVPQLGRFVQMDPVVGGSANPYGYADGDPINSSDLTGAYVESGYLDEFNSEWTVESRIAEEEAAREEAERKADEAAAAAEAAAESAANNSAAKKRAKGKPAGKGGRAQAKASIGCPALSCYPPKGMAPHVVSGLGLKALVDYCGGSRACPPVGLGAESEKVVPPTSLGIVLDEMAVDDTCPVCRTAEIVCGKWTLLLVRDLAEGRSRFCELERSLAGISPRTLSLRLRALEEEGIVERHTYPEVPPRVEYALTEKGEALVPLIDDMRTYGERWLGGDCEQAAKAALGGGIAVAAA